MTCRLPSRLAPIAVAAAALSLSAGGTAQSQSADVLLDCSACHDSTASTPARPSVPGPFPDLSGQPARYIAHQLEAYRKGLRQHRQMEKTATALGDGGAPAMARLYADAPQPDLRPPAREEADTTGWSLAVNGAWERGVPPCASCHGVSADDTGRLAPILIGRDPAYLAHELRAYAAGDRRSDTMGRMRAFAAQLTPSEIDAVAEYYGAWRSQEDEP